MALIPLTTTVQLAWSREQDYAALSEILPQLEKVLLPIASELLATEQRSVSAATSFLGPQRCSLVASRDSADDLGQNCVRSESCQLAMRQWGLTDCKLYSSV